jgi:hypothetical protein
MKNPVLEESAELYIRSRGFLKLHVGYLVLLALFLVIAWPSRGYMYFFRMETVPLVFLANVVFLIILSGFFSFSAGTDRIGSAGIIRYSEWLERTRVPVRSLVAGKLMAATLHTAFLTALSIPVLVAAAGPSGVPIGVIPGLLLVVFLTALACRIAAMIVSHYGEDSYVVKTIGVWVFAVLFFVLTLRLFRPLNPVVAAVEQIAAGAPGAVAGVEPGGTGAATAGVISLSLLTVALAGVFWGVLQRHRTLANRRNQ